MRALFRVDRLVMVGHLRSKFAAFALAIATFGSLAATQADGNSAALCVRDLLRLDVGTAADRGYPAVDRFLREDLRYQRTTSPREIPDGTIVEGSIRTGGTQPDYRINLKDPNVAAYLEEARKIGALSLSDWEKVELVSQLTNSKLPNKSYEGRPYLQILKKYRTGERPVELGAYFEKGSGVCREHALANFLALREAGLKPRYQSMEISRTFRGQEIIEDHSFNSIEIDGSQVAIDSYFAPFHGRRMKELEDPSGISFSTTWKGVAVAKSGPERTRILKKQGFPHFHVPAGKLEQVKDVVVIDQEHRRLLFEVKGRTAAERSFKLEGETIAAAAPDDEVVVEWIFNPFYLPLGHTSLRVGNRLYEFTRKGWELHGGGTDSARAFLFNNAFFKKQYLQHREKGMPPFSIGIPIHIKKSSVDRIESWIAQYPTSTQRPFSLLFNNCNQCMIEAFEQAGAAAVGGGSFENFSSVLTFRNLLLTRPPAAAKHSIYPLSGVEMPMQTYHEMIPSFLYEPGQGRELQRILRNVQQLRRN